MLRDADLLLCGEPEEHNSSIKTKLSSKEILSLKFAPITSCSVERSFSFRNQIFTDRRRRFLVKNIEKYSVCNHYFRNRDVNDDEVDSE